MNGFIDDERYEITSAIYLDLAENTTSDVKPGGVVQTGALKFTERTK